MHVIRLLEQLPRLSLETHLFQPFHSISVSVSRLLKNKASAGQDF